jgi:hypothetical protein
MPRVFHGRIVLMLILAWVGVAASTCRAQDAVAEKEVAADGDSVDRLVNQLRSESFVVREQAMSALYDLGAPALGRMRERLASGLDPESTHRLSEVIRQLAQNDLDTRLDQFLSGEDVSLEGWKWASARLGDNNVIRDTFVLMMQEFPDAVALLDEDSRSRSEALSLLMAKIKPTLVFGGKAPSPVASLALLLPLMDEDVPVSKEVDEMMLTLMKRLEHAKLLDDKTLAEPYKDLISRWSLRSSPSYRAPVLQHALHLELTCALELAIDTLDLVARLQAETGPGVEPEGDAMPDEESPEIEKDLNKKKQIVDPSKARNREALKPSERIRATQLNQPFTVAFALQALARRGSMRQVEYVVPFLDDSRAATSDLMQQMEFKTIRIRTEVGDVAAATIAVLSGVDLNEIGFERASPGPRDGFSFGEVGFMVDEDRAAVKERIVGLIPVQDEKLPPLPD